MIKLETRIFAEVRTAQRRLEGYAAIFGTETRIGSFVEVIRPGAFTDALKPGADILALADHDMTRVLGRTKAGTLRLAEDTRGLSFSLDVPDTSAGRDILALAERGDLGGASFGFQVHVNGEKWTGSKRELLSVNLREISIVSAFPAYPETSVTARASTPRLNISALFMETVR
jgi:uncharacterized protein